MADGENGYPEILKRPIDEILTRAEEAVEYGRRSVERSNKRVRESQFMLRLGEQLRASS